MATTPRSGSNFLCQRLFERAQIQMPKEFLNLAYLRTLGAVDADSQFLIPSFGALLERTKFDRRDSANPICIKVMYSQFEHARTLPGVLEGLRAETAILLLRRDIVAQAVSLYIAEQTGRWTSYARPGLETAEPPYDFEEIGARVRQIDHHLALWRDTFEAERIEHTVVYYEHFIAAPDEFLDTVMHVWQLKPRERTAQPSQTHERQATTLNAEFIERYRLDERSERVTVPPSQEAT